MATVRQPGTTMDFTLHQEEGLPEGERTIFVLKVLDWDGWKAFSRRLGGAQRGASVPEVLEAGRKALGVALVDVRNLKILGADGKETEFTLERTGDELSARSMAVLMPFEEELLRAIQEASQLGVRETKNSP